MLHQTNSNVFLKVCWPHAISGPDSKCPYWCFSITNSRVRHLTR